MGARAFAHVVVACVPPYFRGGSKSGDGNVLRRSNIWCVCDAAPNVHMGAGARRARICDGIHSLFARPKRLSNVGPASAGGSIWTDWQRRQTFAKKECFVLRSRFGARVDLCLFAARADRKSGGGTTASEGDLHAETCLPT